ncbi:peptide transporter PTR2B [Coprinopsis sp. MPI-PUGE-AT-0042]|nr:peptide transporter PTR2B [Coprinopsis sp. MPI-PUGE-AT-0042]
MSSDKGIGYAPSFDERFSSLLPKEHEEIIEGSEGVTQQEFETYRHVSDKFPVAAWLVVVVEFAERWSYYGTTNVFNNYIRADLPIDSTTGAVVHRQDRKGGIAGALGKGQTTSFAILTVVQHLFVYVTPFIGAIVADTMWGRYKTIVFFSVVCLFGHVVLVGSASPPSIAHGDTAMGLLIVAIVIMAIGAGSVKANVSPMIAEQYTGKLRKRVLASGETVIVSPAVTIQRVYLWFYAAINVGAACAISASFLARDHGYWVCWLVPTVVFMLVPGVLLLGKNQYVVTPPRGSILLETVRVIRLALTPAWSMNPVQTIRKIKQPGFWEPAKPSYYGGSVPSTITWDDEFVGEVARTCDACAVFLFFPFYWLCYSQIDGNLSTTAAGMTLNGTPNDLIQNLNPIGIIIMVPIFDGLIYPFLRNRGIDFTPIKRIYAGFLVAGLSMVWSSVLQYYVNTTSPCPGNEPSACETPDGRPNPSHLNVWLVVGPYILIGMSEIFASITSLEYAFTKAPARMKSVVMAFSQFQVALSSAINFTLTAVNAEHHFVWLYASFAICAWVIGTIFFFTFRKLDAREHQLNAIGRGKRAGFADERRSIASGSTA